MLRDAFVPNAPQHEGFGESGRPESPLSGQALRTASSDVCRRHRIRCSKPSSGVAEIRAPCIYDPVAGAYGLPLIWRFGPRIGRLGNSPSTERPGSFRQQQTPHAEERPQAASRSIAHRPAATSPRTDLRHPALTRTTTWPNLHRPGSNRPAMSPVAASHRDPVPAHPVVRQPSPRNTRGRRR